MKMMIYTLLFCSTCSASFGQMLFSSSPIVQAEDKPGAYTGIVVEQYADGHPKLWRQEKNGKANGLWQEWYPNGTLRYRAWWKDGLGNGKWEYFYANGQLRSESFYINDIAQGLAVSYHMNGQVAQQTTYLNGQLDGLVCTYDVNGMLISRKRYQAGIQVIDEPILFQAGRIATDTANEWDITFTPDNQTAYFTRRLTDGTSQKIYQTSKDDRGNWTEPVVAPFSTHRDEGGFISPNGKYFFFGSCRPIDDTSPAHDLDMNIWMMTQTDAGWSPPQPLPSSINKKRTDNDEWPRNYETGPTIDAKGNLYYWTQSSTNRSTNLYTSRMTDDGTFSTPVELIPPSHNQGFDSGPVISPDGTLLCFVSSNRIESFGKEDLYYSRWNGSVWSAPKNLGPVINSNYNEGAPRFSPDGKYFLFSSDRAENFDASGERIWSIYYMETQFLTIESQ